LPSADELKPGSFATVATLASIATGRRIDAVIWRPALFEDEVSVALSGDEATQALPSRTAHGLAPT
jgi:hypothetical protein